jgi:uncharacterized integral membrane protein (TIGR00697 family)
MNKKTNTEYSKYFVIVLALSVASILISNVTSIKIFNLGKIVLPASALLFPITYIMGDVIAEVYGFKKAKLVIFIGFLCNAFMVLYFQIAIKLPSANTWKLQESFEAILSTTPRMFIASLSAYLIGSLSNAYIMQVIKKITKGKHLWIRTIGSTIVGEFLDTIIFSTIAFVGNIPFNVLVTMMVCQFLWKVLYETISTPVTYYVIKKFKTIENYND